MTADDSIVRRFDTDAGVRATLVALTSLAARLCRTDGAVLCLTRDGMLEVVAHTGTLHSVRDVLARCRRLMQETDGTDSPARTDSSASPDARDRAHPATGAAPTGRLPRRDAELVGQPIEILVPDAQAAAHRWHRSAFAATPHAAPMLTGPGITRRRKDGALVPVEVNVAAVQLSSGPVVVASVRDVTERRQAEAELTHDALHDTLTGLPNRMLLTESLARAQARAERTGTGVGVLYIELDNLKDVNDPLGHAAGDEGRIHHATGPDA